jgi:hypothetical protein
MSKVLCVERNKCVPYLCKSPRWRVVCVGVEHRDQFTCQITRYAPKTIAMFCKICFLALPNLLFNFQAQSGRYSAL